MSNCNWEGDTGLGWRSRKLLGGQGTVQEGCGVGVQEPALPAPVLQPAASTRPLVTAAATAAAAARDAVRNLRQQEACPPARLPAVPPAGRTSQECDLGAGWTKVATLHRRALKGAGGLLAVSGTNG